MDQAVLVLRINPYKLQLAVTGCSLAPINRNGGLWRMQDDIELGLLLSLSLGPPPFDGVEYRLQFSKTGYLSHSPCPPSNVPGTQPLRWDSSFPSPWI